MELAQASIVVTGAGSGIGLALCKRFAIEQPRAIALLDCDAASVERAATQLASAFPAIHVSWHQVDVSQESQVIDLVDAVTQADGFIDLFCGNAGIGTALGIDAPNEVWQHAMDVNLMAHVYAARALLPAWLEQGRGYYLLTASAAGLLSNLGDAPYSVSKHGAVALAEWMSITYGDQGVGVSCLCPQGVRTPLLFPGTNSPTEHAVALAVVRAQRILEPTEVADCVVTAINAEQFLILPHQEVAAYEQARAGNRERWLGAMRRLQAQIGSK